MKNRKKRTPSSKKIKTKGDYEDLIRQSAIRLLSKFKRQTEQ